MADLFLYMNQIETPVTVAPSIEPAKPVSPAELTTPLIAGMPDVTQSINDAASFNAAPDLSLPQSPASQPSGSTITDESGTAFDANYHATDENGTPKKNFKGNFYKKRSKNGEAGEERPRTITPTFVGTHPTGQVAEISPEQKRLRAERLAKMVIPTIDRFMQGLLTDGAKLDDTEKSELTDAMATYAEARGMDDIPPGVVLLALFGGIYAEKLSKPTVKERVMLFYMKVKAFFTGKGK